MFYRYESRFYDAFRRALTQQINVPYPRLNAWALQTRDLVRAVIMAANTVGLNQAARRELVLHLDKRDVSMETILAGVRFHAAQEYPHLLEQQLAHNVLALHAANLNDRYLVMRLTEAEQTQVEPLRARLIALRDHLDNAPSEG